MYLFLASKLVTKRQKYSGFDESSTYVPTQFSDTFLLILSSKTEYFCLFVMIFDMTKRYMNRILVSKTNIVIVASVCVRLRLLCAPKPLFESKNFALNFSLVAIGE